MAEVSRRTIERDITRGFKFLTAIARNPEIMRVMMHGAGYTQSDHDNGFRLLLQLVGYKDPAGTEGVPLAVPQEEAIAELDQWDGPNFGRARAALEHRYPEQGAYVFDGLRAEAGPAAIGSVTTFLDRVVALRDGTDEARAASREADAEAAALLEQRRILTRETEQRLRGLITAARELVAPPAPEESGEADEQERLAQEFHAWLTDWREQARYLITRRDYLIQLGLASRRTRTQPPGAEEADLEETDLEETDVPSGSADEGE